MIRFMRNHIVEMIVVLVIVALSLVLGYLLCGCNLCAWDDYGSVVAGVASLVSICLLYITLNHQDQSFSQERFEITFFNLLDQKAKVVKELTFRCEVQHGFDFEGKTYAGEACFEAICLQLQYIKDSFLSPKYLGMMSDEVVQQELESELRTPPELVSHALKYCNCKRANFTYKITKGIYKEAKKHDSSEDDQLKRNYELFLARYPFPFDRYSRLLILILDLLGERKEDKYGKILLAQMSKYELQILYSHSLHDVKFHQHLVQAGLDKLLETEYKSINSK